MIVWNRTQFINYKLENTMNILEEKTLQELKDLRRNWEDTLIREYDVLTEPTRIMMKDKIDEVKKVIFLKEQTNY
jgi:hypothetical protein